MLFAARLVQGAADAITWVVGFALVADLFGPAERGRATGIIMSGTSFSFMIGPSLGGWLYELGGMRTPFVAVVAMSMAAVALFLWIEIPPRRESEAPCTRVKHDGGTRDAPTGLASRVCRRVA